MHGRARGKGKLVVRAKLNRNMKLAGCPSLVGRKMEVRSVSDKYRSNCSSGVCCDGRDALCWYSKNGKVRYGNAKAHQACCEDGVKGVCLVTPVITSIKMIHTGAVGNPNNASVMITFNVPVGTGATGAGAFNTSATDFDITLTGAGAGPTDPTIAGGAAHTLVRVSSTKLLINLDITNADNATGVEVLNVGIASGVVIKAAGVTNAGSLAAGASVRLTDSSPVSVSPISLSRATGNLIAGKSVAFVTLSGVQADIAKIARVATAAPVLSGGSITFSVAEAGRTSTTITIKVTAAAVAGNTETAPLRLVGADGVTIEADVNAAGAAAVFSI